MKLSASINFFNAEELLFEVVRNIRPVVEHLSIVYQKISNWGEPMSDEAKIVIQKLKDENLIDDFVCFYPNLNQNAARNEFNKRKIGLKLAKKANATHFLLMDADEFYDKEQFLQAKQIIEAENITYSCIHSYFYLHQPYYRSELPDTTNVCFITKITQELLFEYAQKFPIDYIDPTRRLLNESGKFRFFELDIIVMHHMNFVRKSFDSKLTNTSSASNLKFIKNAKKALTNWEWPKEFSFPNKPIYNIIKVEDRFNLNNIGFKNKSKILITNNTINNFSGSEIAVYDLAKEFLNLGFQVSIGAFKFDDPLKKLFNELDCDFIDFNKIDNSYDDKFDIIWGQHFTTIDKIFLETNISSNFTIYSSLSPYETLESPPLSAEKINLFLANSFETRNKLLDMGLTERSIYVLPNPVAHDFFSHGQLSTELKKIAIVSNHIPSEIKESIEYFKDNGFNIVLYGLEGVVEFITPSILKEFDAVITIGRTVQYCLAMGIPVYCYDRFGGCGWITSSNIEEASKFNFSGRCSNRKLTMNEIVNEIKKNYFIAKSSINSNREFAEKNYKLSNHLSYILNYVKSSSIQYNTNFFKNVALRQRKYFMENSDFFLIQELWKRINQAESKLEDSERNNQELWKRINDLESKFDKLNKNILIKNIIRFIND